MWWRQKSQATPCLHPCSCAVRSSENGAEELLLPERVLRGGHGHDEGIFTYVCVTVRHQVCGCLGNLTRGDKANGRDDQTLLGLWPADSLDFVLNSRIVWDVFPQRPAFIMAASEIHPHFNLCTEAHAGAAPSVFVLVLRIFLERNWRPIRPVQNLLHNKKHAVCISTVLTPVVTLASGNKKGQLNMMADRCRGETPNNTTPASEHEAKSSSNCKFESTVTLHEKVFPRGVLGDGWGQRAEKQLRQRESEVSEIYVEDRAIWSLPTAALTRENTVHTIHHGSSFRNKLLQYYFTVLEFKLTCLKGFLSDIWP